MRIARVGVAAVAGLVLIGSAASTATAKTAPAPSSFTLTAAGPISAGATIQPVMKQSRLIGLVVIKLPKRTRVGLVPLGTHSGSTDQIPWDLKVNGKTLKNGTYEVDMKVFTPQGKPKNIPGPRPERLVISNGSVTVSP